MVNKETFNILNHKGNANQNYTEILSHLNHNGDYQKKPKKSQMLLRSVGCREIGTLIHCWWKCKLVQLLWKSVWEFLKKLVLYDPATLLLGINKKECKSAFNRDTCTAIFIVALFTIAKPCNPHLSTDKWILKNVKMYIYNTEYYSAIKKNGIMPFAGK
jgi:hypothetical protein